MHLFADAILSKIVTELLKKPSSRNDEWWTVDELLSAATKVWIDMGATPVENYRLLTVYLHSWAGETEPIQGAHRCVGLCVMGLIHWATQPNKESI